jgi:hypothetical protein
MSATEILMATLLIWNGVMIGLAGISVIGTYECACGILITIRS